MMEPSRLTCNTLSDPLGVETPTPKLSWMLTADEEAVTQSAYHVVAASRVDVLDQDRGDLWDTGRVASDQSLHIPYQGAPLTSRRIVFWKVRVWDQAGRVSRWSAAARFEMGLLEAGDWQARWIASPAGGTDVDRAVPAPFLRKAVVLPGPVRQARLYWSGLGFSEIWINGRRVGDAVLAPGFTRYDATVLYQTADVSEYFQAGENVLGALLGNGWYNGFTDEVWNFRQAPWRDQPKLMLQAHITLSDGTERVVASGPDWKTAHSPILFDGLRNGERYDARRERPGWNAPSYDDGDWAAVRIARPPGGRLRSEQMPPIRVTGILRPAAVRETDRGTWLFDVGQNLSGWAEITVQESRGVEITLRYAEELDADGRLDTHAIDVFVKSGRFQTDQYIARGEGQERWAPRFVYHGFRYVEVEGLTRPPTLDSLRACVVHTALPSRGQFACSDPLLNQIQKAARWSTLTNYHSIPTDCPHREKNGWTGDASLSAEQMLLNFDPIAAYQKWLHDFQDVQRPSGQLPGIVPTGGWGYNWGSGPAWDSALFLIPWYVYLYVGDDGLFRDMYGPMTRYFQFAWSMTDRGVADFGLGDWCPPTGGPSGHACPTRVTDTAYLAVMADVLARGADRFGLPADAARYRAHAETVRQVFRERFLERETGQVLGHCQTATATALYQGMLDPLEVPRFLRTLLRQLEDADYHLDTGILGAKYVMHVLTDHGLGDIAYRVASQTTFPSWGYWMTQGATTLWEMWNGDGSHNHHMFSDISAWFYQALAGIRPDPVDPGFHHIWFRPQVVTALDFAEASHDSLYGRIRCAWERQHEQLRLAVSVPVNCWATLVWPDAYAHGVRSVSPAGSVTFAPDQEGRRTLSLGSGDYTFTGERGMSLRR